MQIAAFRGVQLRRNENAARSVTKTAPRRSRSIELGSGVETGGVSGSCGVFGIFPGGKSGGANGGAEELEVVFGPRGSSGSAGILPTGPGNCSNPSAGTNSAKSGGNSGV